MTQCLACLLYAAGAVITIILGVIDTARPHPKGRFRLPRCLGHRYLHHTLAFVCAGLLWPLFVVFVYLRMKVDELEEAGNHYELPDDEYSDFEYMELPDVEDMEGLRRRLHG
ncbi:hypothetical protein LA080_001128 [Diaporthe eres]|uniref:Uncharacterized protein n=1 Tax=Diaporthe vaccinii TaxID=105482 RepID=A0ABR4F827_9PEZI|nr:hypothetical protein LA080_001128 [Diaporthe eres]